MSEQLLWVGIGCKRGISKELITATVTQVFQENQLVESSILGIATIDNKASEVGLIAFCRERNLPLKIFGAEVLQSIHVPNPSHVVMSEVGTFSVAEAAALSVCLFHNNSRPSKENICKLLVHKQIFPKHKGVITIAVAGILSNSL